MRQVTLRLPDEVAARLTAAAAERARSVNAYATAVLAAATDPELADSESARLRARLARAGLLDDAPPASGSRPSEHAVARARSRAARGRSLADLVSEERN